MVHVYPDKSMRVFSLYLDNLRAKHNQPNKLDAIDSAATDMQARV